MEYTYHILTENSSLIKFLRLTLMKGFPASLRSDVVTLFLWVVTMVCDATNGDCIPSDWYQNSSIYFRHAGNQNRHIALSYKIRLI